MRCKLRLGALISVLFNLGPYAQAATATWTQATALTASPPAVVLHGGPKLTVGKLGEGLHFDGKGQWAETAAPVVAAGSAFSIVTWVQIYSTNSATLLTQGGEQGDAWSLNYDAGHFSVDWQPTAGAVHLSAALVPLAHVWYQLAAVYDATGIVRLYLDGHLASEARTVPNWRASGPLILGRRGAGNFRGVLSDTEVFATALSSAEVAASYQAAPQATPLRAPAIPLIVRSPYLSIWQTSDAAPGHDATFWNGAPRPLHGLIRVDGVAYSFFGDTGLPPAKQLQLELTATQSRYTFAAGPVRLQLNFVSPTERQDFKQSSAPFGHIYAQVQSTTEESHRVQLYFDITGNWSSATNTRPLRAQYESFGPTGAGTYELALAQPANLQEDNDEPLWGSTLFAASAPGLSHSSGDGAAVRAAWLASGNLGSEVASAPTAATVFAFSHDLGEVSTTPSAAVVLTLGHIRSPLLSLVGSPLNALWQSYWPSWQAMLTEVQGDALSGALLQRLELVDQALAEQAVAAHGVHYAALCILALRQTLASSELAQTTGGPQVFIKEISSDGNVSTVDVLYPSMPGFLWLNPELLRLALTPLFRYAESGRWPQVFAPHDLGSSYPNASGHDDGGGENMPIEESANMLLMTAAYMHRAPGESSAAFGRAHYAVLKQWADYLVGQTLDPGLQNQTDDFTGFIAESSNLALKGILALGAMGQIAAGLGHDAEARYYADTARSYSAEWATRSQDASAAHLMLSYKNQGSWSLKYNAFPERLLGLKLIQEAVLAEEASWYKKQQQTYGIPLDGRHTYTKADWELWTAAATDDQELRTRLIDGVYRYASETPSRLPFSDWYDTQTSSSNGFSARGVVGASLGLLLREQDSGL